MLNTMPKKPRYPQQELADRLRSAMDEAGVTLAALARECGVTIQAVHDWRETGRIGKQHLVTICRMTGKPFEYFLVGLGRAAAVLLAVALWGFLALPPYPAEAATTPSACSKAVYYVKCAVALLRRFAVRFLTIPVGLRTVG